jgi:hypothetical protein
VYIKKTASTALLTDTDGSRLTGFYDEMDARSPFTVIRFYCPVARRSAFEGLLRRSNIMPQLDADGELEGHVAFRAYVSNGRLEPHDVRGVTAWGQSALPVLDEDNYSGNSVASMIIQKCAAKRQAPRKPIDRVCANPECGKTHDLSTCSRCKQVQYCSRQCQVAHWGVHKCDCSRPDTFEKLQKKGQLQKAKFYRYTVQR